MLQASSSGGRKGYISSKLGVRIFTVKIYSAIEGAAQTRVQGRAEPQMSSSFEPKLPFRTSGYAVSACMADTMATPISIGLVGLPILVPDSAPWKKPFCVCDRQIAIIQHKYLYGQFVIRLFANLYVHLKRAINSEADSSRSFAIATRIARGDHSRGTRARIRNRPLSWSQLGFLERDDACSCVTQSKQNHTVRRH